MSSQQILRFNNSTNMAQRNMQLKQSRTFATAELFYTDSKNLPTVLPSNAMLYTTDTRELYIGTDTGIKRVNIGSDGAVIDATDYLTKIEAALHYIQKDYLDTDNVITKEKLDDALKDLKITVDGLIKDNEYKAEKEDVYTKTEADNRFIDQDELNAFSNNKVDQKVSSATGDTSTLKNSSSGVLIKFQNIANETESYIGVNRDEIFVYSKKTDADSFGGRLRITPEGIFYTNKDGDTYEKQDELITQRELVAIQDALTELDRKCQDSYEMAYRAQESARQCELKIEQLLGLNQQAINQANAVSDIANEALTAATSVQTGLHDATINASSALQAATAANDMASMAQSESADALARARALNNSLSGQIEDLQRQIDELRLSIVNHDSGETPEVITSDCKITDIQNFSSIQVPYNTAVGDLNLPKKVDVTLLKLDDNTELHKLVSVNWVTDTFNPTTVGNQQIVGIPATTAEISNPDNHFAVLTVEVLEQEGSMSTDKYLWTETFVLPGYVNTINDFPSFVGHDVSSASLMGDIDSNDNYIEPTAELFLLGTLNTAAIDDKAYLISADDLEPRLNKRLLNETGGEGLRVPALGVATSNEIADYETFTLTRASVNANGGYSYGYQILTFEHITDAPNVYKIRMKNPSYHDS